MNNFEKPGQFRTIKGSPLDSGLGGFRILVHLCSESGELDKTDELTKEILKRWTAVETAYKQLYKSSFGKIPLGQLQLINVQSDLCIANLITKVRAKNGRLVPKEEAFDEALSKLVQEANYNNGSVYVKKFKGKFWKPFEEKLKEHAKKANVNVIFFT